MVPHSHSFIGGRVTDSRLVLSVGWVRVSDLVGMGQERGGRCESVTWQAGGIDQPKLEGRLQLISPPARAYWYGKVMGVLWKGDVGKEREEGGGETPLAL